MKTTIILCIGCLGIFLSACNGGNRHPSEKASNKNQITGMIGSQPIDYDVFLGYKFTIDENLDGVFDNNTEYKAWMPNDMYYEIQQKDSIIVKAVIGQYSSYYVIFDWKNVVPQDTIIK